MQAVAGGFRANFVLLKMTPLFLTTTVLLQNWMVLESVINLASTKSSEMFCQEGETLT